MKFYIEECFQCYTILCHSSVKLLLQMIVIFDLKSSIVTFMRIKPKSVIKIPAKNFTAMGVFYLMLFSLSPVFHTRIEQKGGICLDLTSPHYH